MNNLPPNQFTLELCKFYLKIEDYDHATEVATFILSNDPVNATALGGMGFINEATGSPEKALSYYQEI